MADTINWLHFSDLHFGLGLQGWFWPNTKHQLFDDLSRHGERLGGWDLVIFTGDFTQAGDSEQYKRLNDEFVALWGILSKGGCQPKLCAVPGNHDLTRPPQITAAYRSLLRDWWTVDGIRKDFWESSTGEYREAVERLFQNYTEWWRQLPIPHIETASGTLPGDFSATYAKGQTRLGIVGLNSTFLQFAKGSFKGKLDLHVSQLNAVCEHDPEAWIKQRTACILLTHQPPTWLHPDSLRHFRNEIYTPGRFAAQFCGHMHVPEMLESMEGGAKPRRYHQAMSLFGLEKWDDAEPAERLHGYSFGQFSFDGRKGEEKLWPVILREVSYGGRKLIPDHEHYDLDQDACVYSMIPINGAVGPVSAEGAAEPVIEELLPPPPDAAAQRRANDLAGFPRLKATAEAQHRFVRVDEQTAFETAIKAKRGAIVVADWGVGKDEFLATCFERFRGPNGEPQVFLLNCEDATEPDAIETVFSQQFGATLQEFCNAVGNIDNCHLVFDWVQPNLTTGERFNRLRGITGAILDSCPKLSITVTARNRPDSNHFPLVVVGPLEEPETRTYLANHPAGSDHTADPDTVAKLHELSEGLPVHLDRFVKDLRVSSLGAISEAEAERASESALPAPETPKALVNSVQFLATELRDQRSFRSLKVLSILPFGETLHTLRHFLPTEPFYPETASRLLEAGLIEAVPLQQIAPPMQRDHRPVSESTAPKILRVPRQVRDYVQSLITKEEREELVLAGIDRLFGRNWRDGRVRFRPLPPDLHGFVASGAGNEFYLIQQISALAKVSDQPLRSDQATQLAVQYARKLADSSRYRDLARVAGDLLRIVDPTEEAESYAELAAMYGEGLRMTGKSDKALEFLKQSLIVGEATLSENLKANIWVDISLAERALDHNDLALAAADEVMKISNKKNSHKLHARAIRASLTLSGDELEKELRRLEKVGRREGYTTVANTIALELAKSWTNLDEKIRTLDAIIRSNDDQYNISRAIVAKAVAMGESKGYHALSDADLRALGKAYSYLYSQRVSSMFDSCHEALWRGLEARSQVRGLLHLFRYTSFIWRIRGEERKEADYVRRIDHQTVQRVQASLPERFALEVHYYFRRFRILVVGIVRDSGPV
jgi:tetratricopeptide (TPR) repeat protein